MGQAKNAKGRTDYDPTKLVSIAVVFSDYTKKGTHGFATFHLDVETTAIDAVASKLTGFTGEQLAGALAEGFLNEAHLTESENFAHVVCAYVGQTRNYQKLKSMMPEYNGFWVRVGHNGNIKASTIARPSMIAPREALLALLEQVRSEGAYSLPEQQFMELIGTPQEPEIMNGFEYNRPPRSVSVGIEDFKDVGEGRSSVVTQGFGQGKSQHGSTLLTGRWYTKH